METYQERNATDHENHEGDVERVETVLEFLNHWLVEPQTEDQGTRVLDEWNQRYRKRCWVFFRLFEVSHVDQVEWFHRLPMRLYAYHCDVDCYSDNHVDNHMNVEAALFQPRLPCRNMVSDGSLCFRFVRSRSDGDLALVEA